MTTDRLDDAITRLARSMTLTRVGMDMGQPAALFAFNIAALRSAIDGLEIELAKVPITQAVRLPPGTEVIPGPIADLVADAITPGSEPGWRY